MSLNKLKWAAIVSFLVSILLLLGGGYLAKDRLPPYPGRVTIQSAAIMGIFVLARK